MGGGGLIWIICDEAEDYVAIWSDHDCIALHRDGGEGLVGDVFACFFFAPHYGLEGVAVEMEGVFAGVGVVEDDVDNLAFFEDEGVAVSAVDVDVVCCWACGEGGEYCGDFGADVGYVVKEGTGFC